ncbi:MAG TPA: ROK family protein, partial [Jatrophihabitans sp.]|nr:ROK family protein [Jatrophihabitans sp.]
STGIGAGLILGGRIHHGARGRAGEIGHVPVDPAGPVCRCGNRGCLETVASVSQVLLAMQPRHGERLTLAQVVQLTRHGDPGALRVVCDAGRMIGRVLADVVSNLNPEMLVLGGELAAAGAPFVDGVKESVERYAQPGIARDLRIELGALAGRSELIGAAALALNHAKR